MLAGANNVFIQYLLNIITNAIALPAHKILEKTANPVIFSYILNIRNDYYITNNYYINQFSNIPKSLDNFYTKIMVNEKHRSLLLMCLHV